MLLFLRITLFLIVPLSASAEPILFPAKNADQHAAILKIYSSLDEPIAAPIIKGFQERNPQIAVSRRRSDDGRLCAVISHGPAGKA
jgi:iron(III) transport system substrate-binding protein